MMSPLELSSHRLFTSASIGLVLSAPDYAHAEDLLRDADIALYRAKAMGKACYQIFDPALRVQAAARLEIETALREALERDEFSLYYQPILSLQDEWLTGFEALIRWRRPGHGLIQPLDFIPLAEETGLIVPIGYWTLREACRQLKVWQHVYAPEPPLTVNVNISSRQLVQPGFTAQVAAILAETEVAAHCLKLEITENVFIQDSVTVSGILGQLRAMGVAVQIDDFGTGYSNLGYLHQLPISALKISQMFVNEIGTDRNRAEILQAVVALAHNLGMSVVVEGVETQEQLAHIRDLHCEEGQGYFICRPLDRDHAGDYLSRRLRPPLAVTRP
jgi:EAL domain-containing protein (putative c-di-GMP-specific phosphodiesterase class I)